MAVVDANVIRVLARLRMLSDDQKSKSMVQLNAQLADSLVDLDRPGCFNQVLLSCPSTLMFLKSKRCAAVNAYAVEHSSCMQLSAQAGQAFKP